MFGPLLHEPNTPPRPAVAHQLSVCGLQQQDVVVDASGEDLPAEWVKKQTKDGRYYYCNVMTGAVQDNSPHDGVADATALAATRPERDIARLFKVRMGGNCKQI